jgi:hypothetical protein
MVLRQRMYVTTYMVTYKSSLTLCALRSGIRSRCYTSPCPCARSARASAVAMVLDAISCWTCWIFILYPMTGHKLHTIMTVASPSQCS